MRALEDRALSPEHTVVGTIIDGKVFEEGAIRAGLMEDLMDRTDLEQGEFFTRAVERVNQRRATSGFGNLQRWVAHGDVVILVKADFHEPILAMRASLQQISKALRSANDSLQKMVDGGSKP